MTYVLLQAVLISAPDGDELSVSRPGALTRREQLPLPTGLELGRPPSRYERFEDRKMSFPY